MPLRGDRYAEPQPALMRISPATTATPGPPRRRRPVPLERRGGTFAAVPTVTLARHVGFGKPTRDGGDPAVYLNGIVGPTYGLFRSDDDGTTWTRINDDRHQFGQISSLSGDPRIYGRLYLGSANFGTPLRRPGPRPAVTAGVLHLLHNATLLDDMLTFSCLPEGRLRLPYVIGRLRSPGRLLLRSFTERSRSISSARYWV